MAFKTVEVGRWMDVVVEGETISVQCLTNGQLQQISEEFDKADTNLDAKLSVIAPFVQVKGVDYDAMASYLSSIASVKAQAGIIAAVFGQNGLSLSEAKNSASLSDGLSADNPARLSTTTTIDAQQEMAESASPTEKKSPVQYRPVTGSLN